MTSKTTKTAPTRWLRYDEAAEYLGASKRQCQRWVQQGRLGHTRLGAETLFAPEQLDAFIASCTFTPEVSA